MGVQDISSRDAAKVLADDFLRSRYNRSGFAHWPLDRQLHAFLAEGGAATIDDYECAYTALYARIEAARRTESAEISA